jgi:hypothetical protein
MIIMLIRPVKRNGNSLLQGNMYTPEARGRKTLQRFNEVLE